MFDQEKLDKIKKDIIMAYTAVNTTILTNDYIINGIDNLKNFCKLIITFTEKEKK